LDKNINTIKRNTEALLDADKEADPSWGMHATIHSESFVIMSILKCEVKNIHNYNTLSVSVNLGLMRIT
jgi:hypothetical protein